MTGKWIFYATLLFVPASFWLGLTHASPTVIFVVSCIAILPLAGLMGEATEQLAQRSGPGIGGLLNATFGNAAELIIALAALRAGLVDLVKASITGSILGNLLLILGLSLLAAGLGRSELKFNRTTAGMSAAMLALDTGQIWWSRRHPTPTTTKGVELAGPNESRSHRQAPLEASEGPDDDC